MTLRSANPSYYERDVAQCREGNAAFEAHGALSACWGAAKPGFTPMACWRRWRETRRRRYD